MALMKNKVAVNFGQGLDTKSDEKLVVPGKLLELENAVFTKAGALNKRNGYAILPKYSQDGSLITQGSALGQWNNELNLYTSKKLLTYSNSTESWVDKGPMVSLVAKKSEILINSQNHSTPIVGYNSGFAIYAWESNGGVKYSVVDQLTGVKIVNDKVLRASGSRPKVVPFGESFVVIFTYDSATTQLNYDVIAVNNPNSINTSGNITGAIDPAYPVYDVKTIADKIFICYNPTTSYLLLTSMDASYVVATPIQVVVKTEIHAIAIASDAGQNCWIAYRTQAHTRASVYSYTLSPVLATTIVAGNITNQVNMTMSVVADKAWVFWEYTAGATYNHQVLYNSITLSGTVGTDASFLKSVGLAGKSFVDNDEVYIPLIHESVLQSTYFIVNLERVTIARLASQLGGTLITNTNLSEIPSVATHKYVMPAQLKGPLQSEQGQLFTNLGVISYELDFTSENRFQNSQLGELYIAGAALQSYDGVSVFEDGFNLYPENYSSTATATTGGFMANGTYSYTVTYEWTDNLGQIHRSIPGIPIQRVLSGGTSTQTNTLTIPTLRLTAKNSWTGARDDVRITVYRTENNGTTYYRVSSLTSPKYNEVYSDTVTFIDTLADATIISSEILYTTGGVIENSPAPSSSLITTFQNRIICNSDDPLEIWYSKERIVGEPAQFSDFFKMRVDARGGDITALAVLDSNLIIFKNSAIYAVAGDGPNNLGEQNSYSVPTLITTDVGCSNPNSIVVTPDGLMFKSTKGIYLLSRGMQASYLGASVEAYNDKLITSAILVANANQIRFTTNDSVCLVYDYVFEQWSTFTNHTAEDSALFANSYCFVKTNGEVWQETPGLFKDDSTPISMKFTTAWLSLDGMQGYERIYKMYLLGTYKSPHKLRVKIGYDFNNAFTQEGLIDVDGRLGISHYGDMSPYGTDEVYGGADNLYQFGTHLTRQKCQTIRFSVQDYQTDVEVPGEGYSITNMAIEVGSKKGLSKHKTSKNFSTGN